jgi:ATP-dependent 26S proteasome regulatory subunit
MKRSSRRGQALPPDVERMVQHLASDAATTTDLAVTPAQRDALRALAAPARNGVAAVVAGSDSTARTKAAAVVANELGVDLYRVDLSRVVSKYIGETEKNLKRVFAAAERAGAVLYFDEADALFGKRTDVKDAHDRFANVEISYLLERLETFKGVAILATNRKASLDDAFMRRIRYVVDLTNG